MNPPLKNGCTCNYPFYGDWHEPGCPLCPPLTPSEPKDRAQYLCERTGALLPRDLAEWWETKPQEVQATIETLRELIREAKRTIQRMNGMYANLIDCSVSDLSARIDSIEKRMDKAVINWHGQTEDGDW